jgi:MFS family permease
VTKVHLKEPFFMLVVVVVFVQSTLLAWSFLYLLGNEPWSAAWFAEVLWGSFVMALLTLCLFVGPALAARWFRRIGKTRAAVVSIVGVALGSAALLLFDYIALHSIAWEAWRECWWPGEVIEQSCEVGPG